MRVRNLHTSVEIIHQNSSKLVIDAPLMSHQSASRGIFSAQGRDDLPGTPTDSDTSKPEKQEHEPKVDLSGKGFPSVTKAARWHKIWTTTKVK